jgi:hypothetical protein
MPATEPKTTPATTDPKPAETSAATDPKADPKTAVTETKPGQLLRIDGALTETINTNRDATIFYLIVSSDTGAKLEGKVGYELRNAQKTISSAEMFTPQPAAKAADPKTNPKTTNPKTDPKPADPQPTEPTTPTTPTTPSTPANPEPKPGEGAPK